MISRRSFLLGLGSLVTTSFAARAKAHALAEGIPLLLDPGRAEKTLHLFANSCFSPFDGEWTNKWQVSLGPWQQDPPDSPTWREYFGQQGYDSAEGLARACSERSLSLEDLDERLPEQSWWSVWEYDESPQAKAYVLLKDLGLDCALNRPGKKAGGITFVEWGYHPGSSERLVELRDDVSVSLLQARLIERNLPIRLVLEQ